jgi:hypothetical protein
MLRLFAQRAHHDRVDVTDEALLQLLRRELTCGGDRQNFRLPFQRPAFARAFDGGARAERVGDADRAFELELAS